MKNGALKRVKEGSERVGAHKEPEKTHQLCIGIKNDQEI
jgi:hypothetical protein